MFDFEPQRYATALFRAVEGRALVLGPQDGDVGAHGAEPGSIGLSQRPDGLLTTNTSASHGLLVAAGEEPGREDKRKGDEHPKQGTFEGVYITVCTSMWSVIQFVRFSTLVGYSGWAMSIGFCFMSFGVQTLTTLSLLTTMSNSNSFKGGSFGILKRNLGGELAGVVGILYYLGMTTLASIELMGAVEALVYTIELTTDLHSLTGSAYWDQVMLGAPLLMMLAAVRAYDVKYVQRFGMFILFAVLTVFACGYVGLFMTLGSWCGAVCGTPGVTGLNMTTFLSNMGPDFAPQSSFDVAALEQYFHTTPERVAEGRVDGAGAVLALLFPCFLGVLQGGNKAKDLKTPNHSVLVGTFSALFTSLLIYLLLFLLLAAVAERDTLKVSPLLLSQIVWPSQFVGLVGTILIGLGACVALLEVGPTVLQSVAEDGLYSFLRRMRLHERSASGEPVNATACSFSINFALLFVSTAYFGDLASVVVCFFLQAYLHMHMALLLNELQQHQSWRPAFKYYHWSLAACGVVVALTLMFIISYEQALVTISAAVIMMLLVKLIEEPRRKGLGTRALGQGRALTFLLTDDMISHRETATREGLSQLSPRERQRMAHDATAGFKDQDNFWDPMVLCILEGPGEPGKLQRHLRMLHLTEQLATRGLYPRLSFVSALVPATHSSQSIKDKHRVEMRLFAMMNQVNLRAFPQALLCPPSCSMSDGCLLLMQSAGLGCLRPNLVLVNWANSHLLQIIRHAQLTEKVIMVLKDLAPLDMKHAARNKNSGGDSSGAQAGISFITRMISGASQRGLGGPGLDPAAQAELGLAGGKYAATRSVASSSKLSEGERRPVGDGPGLELASAGGGKQPLLRTISSGSASPRPRQHPLSPPAGAAAPPQPSSPHLRLQVLSRDASRASGFSRGSSEGDKEPLSALPPSTLGQGAGAEPAQTRFDIPSPPSVVAPRSKSEALYELGRRAEAVPAGRRWDNSPGTPDSAVVFATPSHSFAQSSLSSFDAKDENDDFAENGDEADVFDPEEFGAIDTMEDLDMVYRSKWERKKKALLRSRKGTIDIWWVLKNGGLPVLLGRVLTQHRVWRKSRLRVFAVVEGARVSDVLTANATLIVERMLSAMRITAEVKVIQVNPKTHLVVRTTVLDEGKKVVDDHQDGDGDYEYSSGDTTQGPGTHHQATLKLLQEHDFDEDDDRPIQAIERKSKIRSVFDIFPEVGGDAASLAGDGAGAGAARAADSAGDDRLFKSKAFRRKALELYSALLQEHSRDAQLIILNLPHPTKGTEPKEYHDVLSTLTEGLMRVLFVHSCLDDAQLKEQMAH